MTNEDNDNTIKRMAELLRQGTTLTDIACPACASPLFRLKDQTLWCAKDQKKVVILKQDEELKPSNSKYDKIEQTLLAKAEILQSKIEKTENVDELQKLTITLSEILNTLEKIKKMKKS